MAVLLEDVAAGRRGPAPATITLLSGDVHHAYLAEAWFPGRRGDQPRPAGDLLAGAQPARQARAARAAVGLHAAGRRPSRGASPAPPGCRRRDPLGFAQEPTFDNQIARLDLCGRDAQLCIEKTLPEDWRAPRLHTSLSLGIAPRLAATPATGDGFVDADATVAP